MTVICRAGRLSALSISSRYSFFRRFDPGPGNRKGTKHRPRLGGESAGLAPEASLRFLRCRAAFVVLRWPLKAFPFVPRSQNFRHVGVTNRHRRGKGDLSDKRRWQPKKDAQWTTE